MDHKFRLKHAGFLLFFGTFFDSFHICSWSASALLLCCVWFAFGLLLRAFRAFWGGLAHSGTVSGACWDDFGVFRSILGQCREHVGASWSVFGSMLGHLACLGPSWPMFVQLGFPDGPRWRVWFPFWPPKWTQKCSKMGSKQIHFRVPCLLDFGAIPGSILGSKIL